MKPIVVVGSGPSGVHFALSALEKGHRVTMVDVGFHKPPPVNPSDDFNSLKSNLSDPVEYFLGKDFETLILPDSDSEYYGFPPNKSYIFKSVEQSDINSKGFSPLVSFAAGGLAEAWTGGCYPFSEQDLAEFPFGWREIGPYYSKIAERIGIAGTADDLARFFPVHDSLMEPLELDEHSALLLNTYDSRKKKLNEKHNCYWGRARIATIKSDYRGRTGCQYLGRCLWGCPNDSLYTPSITLRECLKYDRFEYIRGAHVTHFRYTKDGKIDKLVALSLDKNEEVEFDVDMLVLAAGTLNSSRILLESIYRGTGECISLPGLMDNRQIMMPFVNSKLVGKPFNANRYQFHQLAIGIDHPRPYGYVHGLVTTLKTAQIHPVVQSIPGGLGTALALFRNMHGALGLININFADYRRPANRLTLETNIQENTKTRLSVHYSPDPDEKGKIKDVVKEFQRVLRTMGCIAPNGMVHVRPMGASVHYAGTVPMTGEKGSLTSDETGKCRDFDNLYFADGTTFPSLPAKNLTFTLMANAARIADQIL